MKRILMFFLILLLILGGILMFMKIKVEDCHGSILLNEAYQFEYGSLVDVDAIELIDTESKCDFKNLEIISDDLLEQDDFPKVGSYEIKVDYVKPFSRTKFQEKVLLLVKDTTAPRFIKSVDKVEIYEGDTTNFVDQFEVEDLSESDIVIDESTLNRNLAGTYSLKAIAQDKYQNTSNVEFEVIVLKKKVVVQAPKKETHITRVKGFVIVNKKHPLPRSYQPKENSVAKSYLLLLIADMKAEGFDISDHYSGYRSYDYQEELFNRYVKMDGRALAETYSARPGYSEHQTGLTFDVKHRDGSLVEKNPEVTWLKDHAHQYGFIVRYPLGKEAITGYQYEPWHLRYLGDEAQSVYRSGLSLEEYFGIEGGDYVR